MTQSGKFWDKKLPYYWNHINQVCGCWGVKGIGGSSIAWISENPNALFIIIKT